MRNYHRNVGFSIEEKGEQKANTLKSKNLAAFRAKKKLYNSSLPVLRNTKRSTFYSTTPQEHLLGPGLTDTKIIKRTPIASKIYYCDQIKFNVPLLKPGNTGVRAYR